MWRPAVRPAGSGSRAGGRGPVDLGGAGPTTLSSAVGLGRNNGSLDLVMGVRPPNPLPPVIELPAISMSPTVGQVVNNDDSEENVALHQPSLQSGSFLDALPHLAVDGGE